VAVMCGLELLYMCVAINKRIYVKIILAGSRVFLLTKMFKLDLGPTRPPI
jgi:hypothetical protein